MFLVGVRKTSKCHRITSPSEQRFVSEYKAGFLVISSRHSVSDDDSINKRKNAIALTIVG
jgi:hypothetical protein